MRYLVNRADRKEVLNSHIWRAGIEYSSPHESDTVSMNKRKIWSKISGLLANILAEWDDQWKIWGSEIYTMLHADISNGEEIRKQKWVVLVGASLIVSSVTRVDVTKERICGGEGRSHADLEGACDRLRKPSRWRCWGRSKPGAFSSRWMLWLECREWQGQWALGTWAQAGKAEAVYM